MLWVLLLMQDLEAVGNADHVTIDAIGILAMIDHEAKAGFTGNFGLAEIGCGAELPAPNLQVGIKEIILDASNVDIFKQRCALHGICFGMMNGANEKTGAQQDARKVFGDSNGYFA